VGLNSSGRASPAVLIDRPSVAGVLAAVLVRAGATSLLVFEPAAGAGRLLLRTLTAIGVLPRSTCVDVAYADLRDPDGRSGFLRVLRDTRDVCALVTARRIVNDPLIRRLSARWPLDAFALHFERQIEFDLRWEVLRVDMARRLAGGGPATLVVRRRVWAEELSAYAERRGVRLVCYPELVELAALGRWTRLGMTLAFAAARRLARRPRPAPTRPSGTPRPAIALQYGHRRLGGEAHERSELFWLGQSAPAGWSVRIEGHAGRVAPADAPRLAEIGAAVSSGPAAPIEVLRVAAPSLWRVARSASRRLISLRGIDHHALRSAVSLVRDHARWYVRFRAGGVRLLVAPLFSDASVGQRLALEDLGGITAGYQVSISNVVAPTALASPGADIQFIFGDVFRGMWEGLPSAPRRFLTTGFIYDAAATDPTIRERASALRGRLRSAGARYVIAFFDENSASGWSSPFTDRDAASDYRALMRWLLEDETVGVIVKPKKSENLFARIAEARDLIDEAMGTGRLVLLLDRQLVGSVYPAEAALAADIAVSKIMGASAAFEARLAGTPTLLVDTEGFADHPLYELGRGTVVFEDWAALREAVEAKRADPAAHPRLGEWGATLHELDAYRDGRAAERMREHLFAVCTALERGASRAEALACADRLWSERWGPIRAAAGGLS
jgi:hypothetical protein